MLSDTRIRFLLDAGEIFFTDEYREPVTLDDSQFQPVSVDLRLGAVDKKACACKKEEGLHWTLQPGEFVLASTLEAVGLGSQVAALVAGKSSVARYGVQVEAAGLVDPGFWGQLTLEVVNLSSGPIMLFYGERICQIVFHDVVGTVQRPYGSPGLKSRYQGQIGPTQPREDPQ